MIIIIGRKQIPSLQEIVSPKEKKYDQADDNRYFGFFFELHVFICLWAQR